MSVIRSLRPLRQCTRRSFVSTVLLTKSYENETVATLKKELKNRGLSQVGNKATLITRMQESDKQKTLDAISTRPVSTSPLPVVEESVTPGIPPEDQHTNLSHADFYNVQLPDTYKPAPPPTIQIPYVPDFWASSTPAKAAEPEEPKLVLVAGGSTHPDGGPAHNTLEYTEAPETSTTTRPPTLTIQGNGIIQDIAGDLGVKLLPDTPLEDNSGRSRPLTKEERKGLWVLFGLLGGSLALGRFF